MYSFDNKDSRAKLNELLNLFEKFKKDITSTNVALQLCTDAWHLTDWVFNEFSNIHLIPLIGDFRATLYPNCPNLKIMHDLANGSKHSIVSRPKAPIKETRINPGAFSNVFSRQFQQTRLIIEMEDGTILDFYDEIELTIIFWKGYFRNTLSIIVP